MSRRDLNEEFMSGYRTHSPGSITMIGGTEAEDDDLLLDDEEEMTQMTVRELKRLVRCLF